ncbi:MAG: hypothetical protein IRZ16_20475 [Myxococcaceae bacterium]|nr:hypothetical protein [Myxococcaceae bacterium]
MPDAAPQLSPRLLQVLASISDPVFAGRLKKVYLAAAQAVARLGDMDLLQYESSTVEGAPDLSLWEEMAPVIRDTVVDVNALLAVLREQFPPTQPGGLADTIMQAIEEAGPLPEGTQNFRRMNEAERSLHAIGAQLAQQITQLGERMRSPAVVSDRWNLLTDLQTFRSRFREMIGDLVYLSASAFGDVHRRDIVPGFQEEVAAAVAVRAAIADLSRVIAARTRGVEEAEPEDVQWHAQHIERDLDLFGKTAAYKALRAQDKRVVIEFRHELGKIAIRPNPTKAELLEKVRPFADFVASLQRVNNREILVAHDREVWAACGVKLEQAEAELPRDPQAAADAFAEAVRSAMELYGRDPALDAFLRKLRKGQFVASASVLGEELNKFRELLASLPMV